MFALDAIFDRYDPDATMSMDVCRESIDFNRTSLPRVVSGDRRLVVVAFSVNVATRQRRRRGLI